jgi:hypothetical protein
MSQYQDENLVERLVTYTLEFEGKFYIIKYAHSSEISRLASGAF